MRLRDILSGFLKLFLEALIELKTTILLSVQAAEIILKYLSESSLYNNNTSSTDKIIEKIMPVGEIIFNKFTKNELLNKYFSWAVPVVVIT